MRAHNAPGFISIAQEKSLEDQGILMDLGDVKNINKNPIAEKTILELQHELRCQFPGEIQFSSGQLAITLKTMNIRIQQQGVSATEMWLRQDQTTFLSLEVNEHAVIQSNT